jgi:hypothetical protein
MVTISRSCHYSISQGTACTLQSDHTQLSIIMVITEYR